MIAESIGVPVLNVDLVPLRIVGSHGDELPAGETGDVVVSNLINRATVLLNYRLGDVARLQPFRCPCGRSLPLMSFIEGRADDWIQTKLGETVHAQAVRTLFTDEDEIYQYQVRQLAPGRFDVEVVVKHGVDRQALSARLTRSSRAGSGPAPPFASRS
jgi:phenylacetate-CoA ligase